MVIVGLIISVIGAVLFFGTWLDIRYYDYYGPLYFSLNGLDVLTSGTNSIIVGCIPAVVSALFLFMFAEYYKVHPGIAKKAVIICVVIFFLVWFYNFGVSGHIEDIYFDEYHDSGYAGHLAFLVSLVNVFAAYFLEGKLSSDTPNVVSVSEEPSRQQEEVQQPEVSASIRFCPGCGFRLNESEHESGCCSHCGMRFR